MQVRTARQLGGMVLVAGVLWGATPALADGPGGHPGGRSQPSHDAVRSSSTSGSTQNDAVGGNGPAAPDANPTATSGPTGSAPTTPAPSAQTSSAQAGPAQAADPTCPNDTGLPAPVLGTALTTLRTVETTVEGSTGTLPVDPAGTLGGAAGCSSTTPSASPSTSPSPATGAATASPSPVASPSATDASAPSAISASLPEAPPAQAVSSHVSFAG